MENFSNLFWQAYLINFLFWSSLAQGSVIFSASLDLVTARAMHPYARISRRFAAFLPITVIAFLVLAFGGRNMFPWVIEPQPELSLYLNFPFFVLRNSIGLIVLTIFSFIFLAKTRVAEVKRIKPAGASPWAVILVILFMIIYHYLSNDLVLSLSPKWWSTLFQGYYSFSAFYLGAAGLCVAGYLREEDIWKEDLRKLSLLLFGFAPFWIYLLWSQYIVMWYGDLPFLARVVRARFLNLPWLAATWIVIALVFLLPFLMLLSKKAKMSRPFPLLASLSIVLGFMLEKYVLVAPSFSPHALGIGWIHLWITLGYAIIFGICYWIGGIFLKLARLF